MKEPDSPYDMQIGGSHYKNFKIPLMQFFIQNKIPKAEGDIIQYLLRAKGNRMENLRKAQHILEMIILEQSKEDEAKPD